MKNLAFQDEIPNNHCWGCGSENSHGLQIKSFWSGDEAICTWHPEPHYVAGPKHILNGGVIATVIDCHCICTAIAAAYREEGRSMNSKPQIWYATASIDISYLRPSPINQPVNLVAKIQEMKPKKTTLICSLFVEKDECARGEVVAVRVIPQWLESS